MPTLPLPPCRHPGCPYLQTPARNGYCEVHQLEGERQRQRGRFRTPPRERGYDHHYFELRAAILTREPLCRLCKQEGRVTLAAELHHLRPLSEGGENTVDNLVPVCHEHHRSLHAGARQRMGERGRDEAGFSGDEGRRPAAGSFLNACTFSEPVFGGDFHGK